MLRPHYIPPSLFVEGLFCSRRLWLKAHHVEIFDEVQTLAMARTLKQHITGIRMDDTGWIYEARLPSGTRLDAWVPEDKLAVEFKSGAPHPTHVYQAWAIRQELQQLGVQDAEVHLWYAGAFEKEAETLADAYKLDHDWITDDLYAVCADTEDPDFGLRMERGAAILLAETTQEAIPETKASASPTCASCAYFPFCHS